MSIRDVQDPLKRAYREDPARAVVTLTASARMAESGPYACSVELGQAIAEVQAHEGVGGTGTAACSGDVLLSALAACTQITVQMVAAGMGVELNDVQVTVEGDLDLRGTLGLRRDVPVGFRFIRSHVRVNGNLNPQQLKTLQERTERYCVVLSTLQSPPPVQTEWSRTGDEAT